MPTTLGQIKTGAAVFGLAAGGAGVAMLGNPYLGAWLLLVAIGCFVIFLKPEWVQNKLVWGRKRRTDNERERRGYDLNGGSLDAEGGSIHNQDVAVRGKDADIKTRNVDIE